MQPVQPKNILKGLIWSFGIIVAISLVVVLAFYFWAVWGSEITGFVETKQYTRQHNLVNCGYTPNANKLDLSIRPCILQSFESCTPAYARIHSDGVDFEASGGDKSLEVVRLDDGSCGLHYIADGQNFMGSYTHDAVCKNVGTKTVFLELSECEGLDRSQLF